MSSGAGAHLPRVLQALAEEAGSHRYERKLLVCRRMGSGREMLRALSAAGQSWINFEVVTPVRLAHDIAASALTAAGLRAADAFEELTHFDAVIDDVLGAGAGRLGALAESVGLRQAIVRSVQALRLAGIDPDVLSGVRFRDEEKRIQVAAILQAYDTRLEEAGLVDAAAVLERAVAVLRAGGAPPAGRILIAPDVGVRGRTGELVRALLDRGALALPSDPVHGMDRPPAWVTPPPAEAVSPLSWLHDVAGWSGTATADAGVVLDVFAASSVTAELREVLRRIIAAGLRWDEVEIVATDPVVYGVALDGLARRLGIPVSYAAGLPVARTRPGRAAAAYVAWLQAGMPADAVRLMLERGDLRHPSVSGTALARRLRRLGIGRGRERYRTRLRDALGRVEPLSQQMADADTSTDPEDERSAEELAEDRRREREELQALEAVLQPLLDSAPRDPVHVSAAELAQGLLSLIRPLPFADAADRTARARMVERLERIAATGTRRTTLSAASAVLLSRLEDRVPSPESDGTSPWTASGGHLHLSDLEHGGYACRRAVFVVGLDAGRFPGFTAGDALLVDEDRRRLAGAGVPRLPGSAERLAEKRYAFAALAARLRGRVTFSYATWDAAESRSVAPAAELLQAYRLLSGDANADYEALHAAVAPPASAVPAGSALVDAGDTWLHMLSAPVADGAATRTLRRGVRAVCEAYPRLEAGVRAFHARRRAQQAGPYHGVIGARPGLDPRAATPPTPVSATALQTLGACPHRYLLRYVLRVRPPADVESVPDQWLRPNEKGELLHAVFEETLRAASDAGVAYDDDAFRGLALDILRRRTSALRAALPPPGRAVYEAEVGVLGQDVLAFVSMIREDAPRHLALERKFGREGLPPVAVPLPDGSTLHLSGAIDRVDELDDGTLAIIDYKTGSTLPFQGKHGPFAGGRRLQHVLYAAAAERMFERTVARAEFHFPTRRSENHRVRYDARAMQGGLDVVTDLLTLARNGWFVPTNVPEDCRWCDYAAACRVTVTSGNRIESPLAEWARNADDEALDLLRRIRR